MPRSRTIAPATASAGANTNHEMLRRERREIIIRSLEKAVCRLNHPYYLSQHDRLRQAIGKCMTFPKINNNSGNENNGKPHDVETRIALTLYHQWKRDAIANRKNEENDTKTSERADSTNTTKPTDVASCVGRSTSTQSSPSVVIITSDLGLSRELSSPRQLANLICPLLEEDFRDNLPWGMAPDVRSQASGIISMISWDRSQLLRRAGRLPCPHCIQWCKGEKGLWWHQQQYHAVEHSSAAAVAQATTINEGSMVVYKGPDACFAEKDSGCLKTELNANYHKSTIRPDVNDSPMEYIRRGNLEGLKRAVHDHDYRPSAHFDSKGATPLMWAAGGGHLDITQYLIEECNCDPCQSQRGKRSFAGRTAMHWAARNGHVDVVRYLLGLTTSSGGDIDRSSNESAGLPSIPIGKLLEAKTRDGTTAFGWACWQRHLEVMECLHQHGCDIHVLNSYGCSPVLWCSQGTNGNGLKALQWLRDRECNMKLVNHNGHGVLHKAAQRGQRDVAEWLVRDECNTLTKTRKTDMGAKDRNALLALVGPDIEGYCPSDLAGMEGHHDFANWLVTVEIRICRFLDCTPSFDVPEGYSLGCVPSNKTNPSLHVWEQYGGLRRIKSAVTH